MFSSGKVNWTRVYATGGVGGGGRQAVGRRGGGGLCLYFCRYEKSVLMYCAMPEQRVGRASAVLVGWPPSF